LRTAGNSGRPAGVKLLQGFALGRVTLKVMIALADLDDECGVCMPMLCRPFYMCQNTVISAT